MSEEASLAGKKQLLNDLLSHSPAAFAAEFQKNNQLVPAGLQNALHFTDLRGGGLTRGAVLERLYNHFHSTLVDKIPSLDVPTRLRLLDATLGSLADPHLKLVPHVLLDTHPVDLPVEYYTRILPQLPEEVQGELPDKVRRRCWELSPEQGFVPIADSVIQSYLQDKLVKLVNESFDLQVKRKRDKIEALVFLKPILADSKLLLRNFQARVLDRMFDTSLSSSSSEQDTLCGLYFDVLMLTGPADRSSLQDVPYLLEVIKLLEPMDALPVHPDSITDQQRMRLERMEATLHSLYREFARHVLASSSSSSSSSSSVRSAAAPSAATASATAASRGGGPLPPAALHHIVLKLLDRFSKKHVKLYKLFYPKVVEDFPNLKQRYLQVVDNQPMDLKTMSEKDYASVDDILADLQLVYKNCRLFNHLNADLCSAAEKFLKLATDYVREFQHQQQPASSAGVVVVVDLLPPLEQQPDSSGSGSSTSPLPQDITQTCLDCFVAIADPLFARKLARVCWELLYFASFDRGKLPRDVHALRIVAYFLSLAKNAALLRDISGAFTNKTRLVLPRLEDEFVTQMVTRDLAKFQSLFVLRERAAPVSEEEEHELINGSFLDTTTCANVELYWRFLLDLRENSRETHQFLPLYDFLAETLPPPGVLKLLVRKKTTGTLEVQQRLVTKYFLPMLGRVGGGENSGGDEAMEEGDAAATTATAAVDVRLLEHASYVFAAAAGAAAAAADKQEEWAGYAREVLRGVPAGVYASKPFRRARVGFEEFFQRPEFAPVRQELGLGGSASSSSTQ